MEDLALQVCLVDDVRVDDAEGADACGGEVERGGRAEPARPDQEDPGLQQLQLAFLADLGDQQVAAVACPLLRGEPAGRNLERVAVALPVVDPSGERDDVSVAELLEGPGGEDRPVARGAVRHDWPGTVADRLLDTRLEPATRKVDGARDVALVPFLALADVQENGRNGVPVELPRTFDVDLADLLPGLFEQVAVGAHCYPIYSDLPRAMVEA